MKYEPIKTNHKVAINSDSFSLSRKIVTFNERNESSHSSHDARIY